MVSAKNGLIALAAAGGLVQMTPAPPSIIGAVLSPIASGVMKGMAGKDGAKEVVGNAVSGSIIGGSTLCATFCRGLKDSLKENVGKLKGLFGRELPSGVSFESINQCTSQVTDQKNEGILIRISNVDGKRVNVTNVPPACMGLASILADDPDEDGGPIPIQTSNNSLQYVNLSVKDRLQLSAALGVIS